jgi:hypothetical protein
MHNCMAQKEAIFINFLYFIALVNVQECIRIHIPLL